MSELSYLEKLLDGAEVEWLALGQIAKKIYSGGTPDTKKNEYWENGNIPWMSSGEVNLKIVYETEKFITETGLKNSSAKFVPKNSIVMALAGQGKTRGKVARTRIDLTTNQSLAAITLDEKTSCSDYIFHFLETQYEALRQLSSGNSGRGGLNLQMISAYKVPIPCPKNPEKSLAIQAEIVRILDKFTALTAELTAELTERKKQYNYYRDQLLSFEEGDVEWKTLGDVTKKWYSGGTPTAGKAEYYENGEIPWLRTQEVKFSDINSTEIKITQAALKNSAAKWIPENCVIIAISGATAGRSAINKIPLTTNQHCGCLEIDDTKALYRYVFHWVSFNYENIKSLGQGARGDINSTIIKNFKLPIPYATAPDKSLEEQARIVEILDKFDTLTNSITEGLPREIELRQKQYEYYRDLLFSFPKPDSVTN
ncbi:restriction endonuclease subunit S [Salmonella enterica subsp. enterica serovar Montevideo]|uniref:Restriction endonuclease subunit S n=1 Tax=Salmonella enterica TaxID=28901 RepID=A0A5V3S892_SALER|nr:restriction endonuclease subunit S [Salmonella enterica]EDJ7769710.1 restriction endonuclease subunit S [Salmonella enterica subsp. enterica serovar Infantis]EGH6636072.1 restriction endonuclease subunit S [Escherichia coli]EIB9977042.1 restriction endonuclease subunit S [Salmonella enterica subsp. enterica serovar Montevideo]HBR2048831.1 restriction endonuclease subunit S [Klebsiella quasipneumoniae subsp. similipneumoniae]